MQTLHGSTLGPDFLQREDGNDPKVLPCEVWMDRYEYSSEVGGRGPRSPYQPHQGREACASGDGRAPNTMLRKVLSDSEIIANICISCISCIL